MPPPRQEGKSLLIIANNSLAILSPSDLVWITIASVETVGVFPLLPYFTTLDTT